MQIRNTSLLRCIYQFSDIRLFRQNYLRHMGSLSARTNYECLVIGTSLSSSNHLIGGNGFSLLSYIVGLPFQLFSSFSIYFSRSETERLPLYLSLLNLPLPGVAGCATGAASRRTDSWRSKWNDLRDVSHPLPLPYSQSPCFHQYFSSAASNLWMFNMSVYLQFLSVLRACFAKPQVQAVVFSPPC